MSPSDMQEQESTELQAAFASDIAELHTGSDDSLRRLVLLSDVVLSYADGTMFAISEPLPPGWLT